MKTNKDESVATTGNPSCPTNLRDLSALAEFEISRLQQRDQLRGWNVWGLVVAIATLCGWWIESTRTEGIGTLRANATVYLVVVAAVDLLVWINMLLREREVYVPSKRIRVIAAEIAGWRPQLAVSICHFATIGALQFNGFIAVDGSYATCLGIGCIALCALSILCFALSFASIGVGSGKTSPLWLTIAVNALIYAPFITYYIGVIGSGMLAPTAKDVAWKQGTIIAACVLLLQLVARIQGPSPTIERLLEIRRDITLANFEEQAIASRLRIALFGLDFESFIQSRLSDVLNLARDICNLLNTRNLQIRRATEIIDNGVLSDSDAATLKALMSSADSIGVALSNNIEEYNKKNQALMFRVRVLGEAFASDEAGLASRLEDEAKRIEALIEHGRTAQSTLNDRAQAANRTRNQSDHVV